MIAQPPPPPPPAPAPEPTPALSRGWLRDLLRGIRRDGVQPRDPRVKALWGLLRRRQLLGQSPWLRDRLRYIWQQGLNARHRPRTTSRLLALLRNWGVLSARPLQHRVASGPVTRTTLRPMQRLRPVALRRVASLRPMQPLRPSGWRGRGR